MPQKRPGSPFYQVRRRNLVGVGDTGVLSTGVRSRRVAERMERAIEELAERALLEPAYRSVLGAVVDKRLRLPILLEHHVRGALPALLVTLSDPSAADAIEAMVARLRTRDVRYGADLLLALLPARARLSYLRDRKNVRALCERAERGEPADATGALYPRMRNTVRRHLLGTISRLLTYELGRAERDQVFAELHFPATDDTREVILQPAEIHRLLEAAAALEFNELAVAIRLAMLTSADRGTLFAGKRPAGDVARGLLVRDLRIWEEAGEFSGTVFILDSKTSNRPRTVPLTDSMCRALVELTVGKGPDETVFETTYAGVDHHWQKVRAAAGLPALRFKDLRAQTAIYGERAGVPLTVMSRGMGHGDESMTRKYQRHRATISPEQVAAIEHEMGLGATSAYNPASTPIRRIPESPVAVA